MLLGVGSAAYGVVAGGMLVNRKPILVLDHNGIDVILRGTGLIRYSEIVHIDCFALHEQSAVAIFVSAEKQARLPVNVFDRHAPVFANELFAGPPIWFADGALDCTAAEIATEIDARRRGTTGPLTARKLRR